MLKDGLYEQIINKGLFSNSLPFCIISISASKAIFGEGKSAASKLLIMNSNCHIRMSTAIDITTFFTDSNFFIISRPIRNQFLQNRCRKGDCPTVRIPLPFQQDCCMFLRLCQGRCTRSTVKRYQALHRSG